MRTFTALLKRFKNITASRPSNVRTALAALAFVALTSSALTARNPPQPVKTQTATLAQLSPPKGASALALTKPPTPTAGQALQKFEALINKATVEGSARVIVGLRSSFTPEGMLKVSTKASQRAEINRKQNSLLGELAAFAPMSIKQFRSIPYIAMTVNAQALDFMRASAEVEDIREDGISQPTLAESTVMTGADKAWGAGFSGQGQVVAILDTGVEKTHPFINGKIISEACFSSNVPEQAVSSLCPAKAEESTTTDSGLPCTLGVEKGCEHGTHVAGIAAGRFTSGGRQGVARDAGLVAIQVFSRFDGAGSCGKDRNGNDAAPCVQVFDSDYMLGLEHVLALKQKGVNIASANLSLGTKNAYSEKCDEDYRDVKKLIDNLESVGVATIVSSGNGNPVTGFGYTNAISAPACISSAISVGSVGDGSGNPERSEELIAQKDIVSTFSNSAPFLKLLAPGEWINSSSLNGDYKTLAGTSMAAPHVAGAWAVLKQRAPNASVAQILAALQNTGRSDLVDPQTGLRVPRIQIDSALQALLNCNYSLPVGSQSVSASGDIKSFNISAPAGCPWTASSSADWISTDASGSGSGTVVFTAAVNSGAARVGVITVGGQNFIVNQAAGSGDSTGQFKLAVGAGSPKDLFGNSVAISGGTVIIGAPGENVGTDINKGSAYVYVRNADGTWSQQAKLLAADSAAGDDFGWSVAIDGDTAVIGARSAAVGTRVHQGAVYVFVRSGTTWTQQAKLVSQPDTSLGVIDDHFGECVAIYGNRLVVGSPGFETFGLLGLFQRGSFYVFTRSGGVWTPQGNPIQGISDQRDGRLATADFTLQGNLISAIVIGIPRSSPGSILGSPPSNYGAINIFVHKPPPIEWPEQQNIFASDFTHGDRFGESVAISSDGNVIAGSSLDDIGTNLDQGSAYVLTPTLGAGGVKWTQQAKLTADDGTSADQFGSSVAISGNFAIVGARFANVDGNSKRGAAYVFERAGTVWTQKGKLKAEDGEASDEFGTCASLSNGTAVVGAPSDDLRKGSAHIFSPLTPAATSTVRINPASYSVDESAQKVTVTVERAGSTAAAAAVTFSTEDVTADGRRDYTQTLGTLNFTPGETVKSVTIFVTDDALLESPETFLFKLSNATGTALGSPSSAAVTITSNDTVTGPNPIDDAASNTGFYVGQHYVDFLNREADVPGLSFWTNEVNSCGSNTQCREVKRINVSAAFFLSIEFQNTGYLAYCFYKAAYGDATSPGVSGTVPVIRLNEFLPDTQRIGQGVVVGPGTWQQQLDANKHAFALEFITRHRFLSAYPTSMTPAQFVDKLRRNTGAALSQTERDQLVSQLTVSNTTADRAAVLRKVAEDADLQQSEKNRAFVLMQYFGYLKRNPDDAPEPTLNFAGWKFWLDKLNQFNGNFVQAEMVKAFISSDEYRRRFGQ